LHEARHAVSAAGSTALHPGTIRGTRHSMRVAIVGAGAVGGLLGALLARAGHAVSFVTHGESLEIVRAVGVSVTAPGETFATGPLRATVDPGEIGPCDLVVMAVKAWHVESLAPSLAPLLGPGALVVPVQNGVEASDHLASALGEAHVAGGLCHVLATREGPGRVRYVGAAPQLTLGERAGGSSARLEALAATLRAAGITVSLSADIQVALWSKLLFVEPFGSVGAVTRSPVDVVRALPETRSMLERAMREVQSVAAGRGVRVPDEAIAQSLARVDAMPAGATASMHRDLVEGRPSELNEQTGAVVRLGRRAGIPCTLHEFLLASLLPQELRARAGAGAA
jgi:2-dehydropantoate 2-reductase